MKESPDPREALKALIEHFEQNLYALKSPQYNEAQVRQEFINPSSPSLAGTWTTGRATPRLTRTSSTRTPSR